MPTNNKKKDSLIGIIASFFLAVLCLFGGMHQSIRLRSLLQEGQRADAQVSGIHRGVKGLKTAILKFKTGTQELVTARDMFPMMLIRFKKGENVTVWYNPADTRRVTIDLGFWMWQQPVAFFVGFILLSTLGVVLPRIPSARKEQRSGSLLANLTEK